MNGAYPEASMRLIIRTAASDTQEGLEAQHEFVDHNWEAPMKEVHPGDVLRPDNSYVLNFDQESPSSLFQIQVEPGTHVAFFAEHLPSEFEKNLHFLTTEGGEEVHPTVEVSSAPCEASEAFEAPRSHLWEVVVAAMISILPTLMGIFMLCVACKDVSSGWCHAILHFVNAGASGVMFAAAAFLLMPEASHLLGEGLSEVEASVACLASLLAGVAASSSG